MNLKKEIIIRSIKILDIGFITSIYIILGIVFAKILDHLIGKFDEEKEKEKSNLKVIFEIILLSWFMGIIIYIVRNVISLIPFPLHGYFEFNHFRVKELTSAYIFCITFIYFQEYYQLKVL